MLGAIIERVSGDSYATFVRQNIFEPLQLTDTGDDDAHAIIKHRADGYKNSRLNADYLDMSRVSADGGLYSTVEDLYRWDQALYTEQLVSKPLLDTMFAPAVAIPNAEGTSYGYGWYVGTEAKRRFAAHGGGIDGFSSSIIRHSDERVTIIVLSNQEDVNTSNISFHLAQMIFEGT